jgi:3-hydroxyacyl-[acyl-carrier-protein] dehydratase
MIWDKEKIKSILPQREPFLFIDEIIDIENTQKVVAVKQIGIEEPYFKGHFPGNPIMPGVLIIEAMAQTAIILYSVCKPKIAQNHPDYYLGKVKSEFLAPVHPGDKMILEAHNVKIIDTMAVMNTFTYVNDKLCAKAELVLGLKIKNG